MAPWVNLIQLLLVLAFGKMRFRGHVGPVSGQGFLSDAYILVAGTLFEPSDKNSLLPR